MGRLAGILRAVRRAFLALAAAVSLAVVALPAHAVQPNEMLDDPVLEKRARALSAELRCVVCQNQSIDDSNAPLARDLRIIVRERLTAGDTDSQVIDFIVARYGNFVLLRPPVQTNTIFLWFGPAVLLVLAIVGFGALMRRRSKADPTTPEALSDQERARLNKILKQGTSS